MSNENNKNPMTFGRFLAILSVILVFVALICAIVGTVNNQAQDFNSQRNNSYNGGSSSSGYNNTHTHEWRYSYIRPATCTEYGYTIYYCAVCHQEKKVPTAASPLGHNYTSTVVAPTCTEGGYTEHICSRCGDSYRDNTTSATGVHSYEAGNVTIGDCPLSSYQTYTCSNCGSTKQEFVSSGSTISTCHHDLEVGDTCEHCGHSVYSKTNDTVIMSLGENKLSVEYYGTNATQINSSLMQYVANVFFADSVTSIGNSAFYGCSSLTSVTIPDSVTSIGDNAFYACRGLTSVTMKDELYAYIDKSFRETPWYNSLETEEVNGVSYRRNVAMGLASYTGLPPTSITIKSGTIAIAVEAFSGKDFLTSVTIPDSVTSIGDYAFRRCSGLTSVTIGNSVTSIGEDAFYNCTGLTSVYFTGDIASWCSMSRLSSLTWNSSMKLYIKGEELTGDVVIPSGVLSIPAYAFCNCTGLTSITIPDSVTSIGAYAFRGCSGLTSVTIGNSVTSIARYAFYNCTGLTSVTIGNGVTSIGEYAFSGLSSFNYNGTKVQWSEMPKYSNWNNYQDATIHCTDGDIYVN